jgi:hypothetical protein
MQMLQIIALGASLVFLTQYYFHPSPVHYLIIGIMIFIIKLFGDWMESGVFYPLVFDGSWLKGWLLPPGTFTPIPWLFVFFLGVYAYQSTARTNLYLSLLTVLISLAILFISRNPAQIDLVNKWDMSLGYFLFSCFCLFFSFSITKMFPFRNENILIRYCQFLGKNSLLFLYVHIFFIQILFRLGAAAWVYFYWPLVLALSSILIEVILILYPKTRASRLFHSKISWLILIICVMVTPLVFKDPSIVYILEFFWGVCLSTNYGLLKNIFREQRNNLVNSEIALLS